MSLQITVNGIGMNTDVPDGNGCLWYVSEFDGWDGAAQRGAQLDFAAKDGQAPGMMNYSSRALNITGLCKAPNEDGFWKAYNLLTGATGDLNADFPLTVVEGTIPKTLTVRRASQPQITIGPGSFTFSLPLTAFDPIKYGEDQPSAIGAGATGHLTNDGNYPSLGLVFTTTGVGTVRLEHEATGRTLTTGKTNVDAGTVIDVRARTVYSGDVNRYGQLSTRSLWWALLSGANTVLNKGTAGVTVRYRPAWV